MLVAAAVKVVPAAAFLAATLTLLLLPLPAAGPAAAAPGGTITVDTGSPYYGSSDDVDFTIHVDTAGADLDGDLLLEVLAPASPADADPFSGEVISDRLVRSGYSVSGTDDVDYQAGVSDLGLDPGGYPVRVSIVSDGEVLLAGCGWLAVVDPDPEQQPLDLVMVAAIAAPPQRNAGGDFVSTELLDRCRADASAAESLGRWRALAERFPGVKTVYAVEPLLLEELGDMADGFVLDDGGKRQEFDAASPEASAAASCLEDIRAATTASTAEILSTPYAFSRLSLLAREGWDDGSGQYRVGDDVIAAALAPENAPTGGYAPGLEVTTDSLRYLSGTGSDYTVFSADSRADLEGETPSEAVSFRIRDLGGERITGVFADAGASTALFGAGSASAFFAALAGTYAAAPSQPLVVAAAAVPSLQPSPAEMEKIYAALDDASWVQTMTLAEAVDRYRPDSRPLTLFRYVDPASGYVALSYYQRLSEVHAHYQDLARALDPHEPVLLGLEREMYTGESGFWAGDGVRPEAANAGLAFLDGLEEQVGDELDLLSVHLGVPWLQRASAGTAVIKIDNDSDHPFTITLELAGDGVEFPEGYDDTVRVEPGITRVEVPFRSQGWNGIEARLKAGAMVIAADGAVIHPISGRVWIAIAIVLSALAAGILYYYLVVRRRQE